MRFLLAFILTLVYFSYHEPDFEVHEWGVFNFYQGSGVDLLAGTHSDDLPDFVTRAEKKTMPDCCGDSCKCKDKNCPDDCSHQNFKGTKSHCPGKCQGIGCYCFKEEKPVINFFSKSDVNVHVSVKNSFGKFTVWFPKHTTLNKDGNKLSWDLTIIPSDTKKPLKPRNVNESSWWRIARETESAFVSAKDSDVEKFIFYEGAGDRLEAGIKIKTGVGNKVEIQNKTKNAFKGVFVVRGSKYFYVATLEKSIELDFDVCKDQEPAVKRFEKMLADLGLTEKEAKGIAKIWEKEFFASEGLRAIYVMANDDVEKSLPLEITPKPKKLVRVMIACVNETDSLVDAEIKKLGSENPTVRDQATEKLIRLGIGIKPHIEKALKETKDIEVKARLQKILEEFDKIGTKGDGAKCLKRLRNIGNLLLQYRVKNMDGLPTGTGKDFYLQIVKIGVIDGLDAKDVKDWTTKELLDVTKFSHDLFQCEGDVTTTVTFRSPKEDVNKMKNEQPILGCSCLHYDGIEKYYYALTKAAQVVKIKESDKLSFLDNTVK